MFHHIWPTTSPVRQRGEEADRSCSPLAARVDPAATYTAGRRGGGARLNALVASLKLPGERARGAP